MLLWLIDRSMVVSVRNPLKHCQLSLKERMEEGLPTLWGVCWIIEIARYSFTNVVWSLSWPDSCQPWAQLHRAVFIGICILTAYNFRSGFLMLSFGSLIDIFSVLLPLIFHWLTLNIHGQTFLTVLGANQAQNQAWNKYVSKLLFFLWQIMTLFNVNCQIFFHSLQIDTRELTHLRAVESMTTSESFSFVSTVERNAVDCSATTLTCLHSFSENSTKPPRDVVANKTALREVSV